MAKGSASRWLSDGDLLVVEGKQRLVAQEIIGTNECTEGNSNSGNQTPRETLR